MGDSHNSHVHAEPAAIAASKEGWSFFTKVIFWSSVSTAVVVALVIALITR